MVKIDGSKPGDETVTYDKGGWVFWMLANLMGRENMLHGLQEFVRVYQNGPDYPVLQDLTRTLRPFAPDSTAYDAFVKQWFLSVSVPQYQLSDAKKARSSEAGHSEPQTWDVRVHVKNIGSGSMPVEIAAVRGERFPKKETKGGGAADSTAARSKRPSPNDSTAVSETDSETASSAGSPDYREARATIRLGAGEEQDITLSCPFEPERVLVDPDALVLQLERKAAVARF